MAAVAGKRFKPADVRAEAEYFRSALETSPFGIQIMSRDGELLYVNQTMLRIFGYATSEELFAVPVTKRFTPESLKKIVAINEQRKRGEIPPPYELTIVRKDGSTRELVGYNNELIWDGQKCFQIQYQDVTEQKRIDALYRTLAESSPVGVYIVEDGKTVYVNPALIKATGYSQSELLAMDLMDLVLPEDVPRVRADARAMVKGESRQAVEFRYVTKGGEVRWAFETVSPIFRNEGRAVLGSVLDITETKVAQRAWREVSEKYDNLLTNVGVGIFASSSTTPGKFLAVNRAMETITGYSRDELLNINVEDTYVSPGERQEKLARFEIDGPSVPIERLLKRKDGSVILTRSWLTATRDSAGKVTGYEGIMEDITERRKMEESLRLSDTALRSIHDAVMAMDSQFIITYWSVSCETLFGVKASDAIGKYVGDVVSIVEDYPGQKAERLKPLLARGYNREEQRWRSVRGEVWVDVRTHAIESGGQRTGWITLATDITERKMAQESLRQSEEKLRLMFQSVAEGIVVTDLAGMVTEANQVILDMLGLKSKEDMIGRSVLDFVADSEREIVERLISVDVSLQQKHEITVVKAGGEPLSLEISVGLLRDAGGHPAGAVVTARDVTETRRLQQQLIAQDRLASIGELVSGIAHELNNPLTSVIGFAHLLLERPVPDDIKEDLGLISSEAQRAVRIVKDLLTFARKHHPVKQLSQLNNIIEDVLRLRAYEHKVSSIEVVRHFQPDLPEIMVDYYQMQQVFLNLIINAEYFMTEAHKQGTLTITTEARGGFIRATVTDDGPGISKENMKHIFDPFFTTKDVGKGTGLGLSICHGIVSEHNGRIFARSELGKGATFIVELPVNVEE